MFQVDMHGMLLGTNSRHLCLRAQLTLGDPCMTLFQRSRLRPEGISRHDYGVKNYVAAAQHLADLQAEGVCRHIGVTNFDVPRLRELLDAGVRIASNQAGGPPASCMHSAGLSSLDRTHVRYICAGDMCKHSSWARWGS